MSNVMLFGAGRMGAVIAHAMEILGHNVSVADASSEALNLIELRQEEYKTYHINDLDKDLIKLSDFCSSISRYKKGGKGLHRKRNSLLRLRWQRSSIPRDK